MSRRRVLKTIIAGSRGISTGVRVIAEAVQLSGYNVTEVVSGGAKGIDTWGEIWAATQNIPVKRFPVTAQEWEQSRAAGLRRNERMAEYAEALVAIWDGVSRGTKHMIDTARSKGLLVFVHLVQNTEQDGTAHE